MSVPATSDRRKRTRRGRRGKGGREKPYSEASTVANLSIKTKTLTPLGGMAWIQGALGTELAEALNTDQVTMQHRKMILEHPQMSAAMLIFGAFLASTRWKIKCDEPEIRAFATTLLRPIWRRLIKSMLKGVAFGYVPFERKYKNVRNLRIRDEETDQDWTLPNAIVYHGLKALPADSVELWIKRDRYAGFAQKQVDVDRLEPDDTFWYAHDMDAGQLFGCPRVNKGTMDFWVYNIVNWQHLMRYMARIASPPIKGWAPDGYRRKLDPDTNERTLWQPIRSLHDAARGLQEAGVLIMPMEETPSGKPRFDINYLTDPSPSVPRILSAITESGHMMLYSVLLPPQMFESLTPGRGQGYGSVASLGGLAAEGVDAIMADMADAIENGDELYGIPDVLQQPIRHTYGPDAPHAYLVPNKTSRNRLQLLGEMLNTGIRTGRARVDFDAIADEVGVASMDEEETEGADESPGRPKVAVPGESDTPETEGRAQTPEMH